MAVSTTKQRWMKQNITHTHCYTAWYMRQQINCASWHLRTPIRVHNMRPSNPEHKSYTYVTFIDAIRMMWQTDQTRPASQHILTFCAFLPIMAHQPVRQLALVDSNMSKICTERFTGSASQIHSPCCQRRLSCPSA